MPQPAIMCSNPYAPHDRDAEHECLWYAGTCDSYCCKHAIACRNEDCESTPYLYLCANEVVHDFFNKHHVIYNREEIRLAEKRGIK